MTPKVANLPETRGEMAAAEQRHPRTGNSSARCAVIAASTAERGEANTARRRVP